MSAPVIILGMHRSYTTLLAQWLHLNGIQMFEGDAPPNHHEDPRVFTLHEQFLAAQQMNWLNAREPFTDPGDKFRNLCYAYWKSNTDKVAWGWKDPRTTILFEFLWSAFASDAKLLAVFRNPADVVASLFDRKVAMRSRYRKVPDALYRAVLSRNRNQYDVPHLICWNYYNRLLIRTLQQVNSSRYVLIHADTLTSSPQAIRSHLQETWEHPLAGPDLSDLMHHRPVRPTTPYPPLSNTALWEEAHTLYATLLSMQTTLST